MQQAQAGKATATEAVRARLSGFLDTPLIRATERAWHPADLTDLQQRERVRQEIAMRNGKLRALPSCFGELA